MKQAAHRHGLIPVRARDTSENADGVAIYSSLKTSIRSFAMNRAEKRDCDIRGNL